MDARAGRNISCARAMRSMWSIRWRAGGRPIGRRSMVRSRLRGWASPRTASSRPSASRCGRRRICTRSSRGPASPAIRISINSTPRSSPPSSTSPSNRSSTPRRWSPCSTRSGPRSCSPIPSPAPSAGRSPTGAPIWSRRSWRSSRAGRPCTTSRISALPTGSRIATGSRSPAWPISRSLTIRRSPATRSSPSCAPTSLPSRISSVAGASRSPPASSSIWPRLPC